MNSNDARLRPNGERRIYRFHFGWSAVGRANHFSLAGARLRPPRPFGCAEPPTPRLHKHDRGRGGSDPGATGGPEK